MFQKLHWTLKQMNAQMDKTEREEQMTQVCKNAFRKDKAIMHKARNFKNCHVLAQIERGGNNFAS